MSTPHLIQDIIPVAATKTIQKRSAGRVFFGEIRAKVTTLTQQVGTRTVARLNRRSLRQQEPHLIQDIYRNRK